MRWLFPANAHKDPRSIDSLFPLYGLAFFPFSLYVRGMGGPSKEQRETWRKDPANYRLGVFYYNPADKRLLPPKRIKQMGWTVNFAQPGSILIMAVIFAGLFALWSLHRGWC